VFERPHHRAIARLLDALDGPFLREKQCLFGGGTAIVLRHGEYRQSVDVDFLVSDLACYRDLRQVLAGAGGFDAVLKQRSNDIKVVRDIRTDQYGIRTVIACAEQEIKFEIVLEGRIRLEAPGAHDEICGVATLVPLDMVTSKLLANSDRWADDGVFSRDLIDLAMMAPALAVMRDALVKAEGAYGKSIRADLTKAIERLRQRAGWIERCMQVMAISVPKALIWQRVRRMQKMLVV
jgi:hypothetical protein